MKRLSLALALGLGLTQAAGCFPGYYGRSNLAGLLWTVAVVGVAVHLATHDAHNHWDSCGHYRQWHDGRWVYWYQEHWEYYDPYSGRWYYYN